ncbi:spore germination protein GerLB [Lentibacillus halophilus]|uniref:Spore germination protein GerLB n=1 Tax=Lentibacillus halophilus TaxID=295065 RepID=A0ABP3IWN2_9BACI
MKTFEYADDQISDKEIMIATPSVVIGVSVLSLPRTLTSPTNGMDGVIALGVAGLFVIALTWLVAKLAVQFPHENFYSYASSLIPKPAASMFTMLFAVYGLLTTAYETRVIADVAEQYLFTRTPFGVIALTFLLVVIYAVSGSRAGLFRLHMMFFPFIVLIILTLVLFTSGLFDPDNLFPVLTTGAGNQWPAFIGSTFSFMGFAPLLFYTSLVKKPRNVPKKAAIGMSIAVTLYMVIAVMSIGAFGNLTAGNLQYPTVELAKDVEIPGGFFERFETVFFVIWIMTIFNTTIMFLDMAVFAMNQLFTKISKMQLIFICSPFIYMAGMIPKNNEDVDALGTFISMYGFTVVILIVALFFIARKWKRGKKQ